jgi:hypothetical protein
MAVSADSFGGRTASRYGSARHALALLVLVVACVAFAAEKTSDESYFLALHFADGNTASIQLSNVESNAKSVDIERYSSSGKLLEQIKKTVPAGGNSEVRLDLSSPTPEFGWIRVLPVGRGVNVSASLEVVEGNTLVTLPEKAVYRHPELTKHSLAAVNALDEPRVSEFSPRGGGLPGVFVGIRQRAEDHFGQRVHVREQSLLPSAHPPNLFRIPFERSGDALFGFVERCIYPAQLFLDRCAHESARAIVAADLRRLDDGPVGGVTEPHPAHFCGFFLHRRAHLLTLNISGNLHNTLNH